MASPGDIIEREDEEYRRGVVLGLTLAEVTILLLFCLLMTALVLIQRREHRIAELERQHGTRFVVSEPIERVISELFGNVNSQKEIEDNFEKLSTTVNAAKAANDVVNNLKDAIAAEDGKQTENIPDRIKNALQTEGAVKKILGAMGKNPDNPEDIKRDINKVAAAAQQMAARGELLDTSTQDGKKEAAVALSKSLCELQYEDPVQRRECEKKVTEIAGGKGLEFRSCWWDKSVVPWRTKNIYEVALTDYGYTLRSVDPGTEEYRLQKEKELPVGQIKTDVPLREAEFTEQTAALYAWSEANKCRFYVRVFDETGETAKNLFKSRLTALEGHFYKEFTTKHFDEAR